MTRHLDPDRSPPPRFWPFPIDIDTSVCSRCSAMVPATDKAQAQHTDHHRQVDALAAGFASAALASQLSGSGSRTATPAGATADASPDPDPASGSAPERELRRDPDLKSPPTPPEEATAGPGGAEGSNQVTEADAAAGTSLGDVTKAPAPFPPGAGATNLVSREEMLKHWEPLADSVPEELGGTKRVGRGSGGSGDSTVSAPADTTRSRPATDLGRETTGRLRLPELEPGDYRRFAR